jgi:hypothetical protein
VMNATNISDILDLVNKEQKKEKWYFSFYFFIIIFGCSTLKSAGICVTT